MRGIHLALAAGLVVGPTLSLAADEGEISLGSIATAGAERRIGPETLAGGPGAVLAAAAGVERLPAPCGTPFLMALLASEATLPPALRPGRAALLERPALPDERVLESRDGRFNVHYAGPAGSPAQLLADRDRNGSPDAVDRLAEALEAARSYLVARLGYPPPAPDGERLDVYLLELGRGLEGLSVPPGDGSAGPAAPGFIVLDAGLAPERLMPAALHQVAHAALAGSFRSGARWWHEATAAYLTLLATGDLKAQEGALRARLQSAARGLASDSLPLMQGSLLWPLFLAERAGDPGVVRQVWVESALQGGDPLAAADTVLRRLLGTSLAEAHREYAAWNLFTGGRDDGLHYAFGRALPEATLQGLEGGPPVDLETVDAVEPLGSLAFRLPGDGRGGALDLEVRAEGGAPGADLLVAYRAESPRRVLVPVPRLETGLGRVSIPWSDAFEVWIVLRNDAAPTGALARFRVRAAHDPYAPFDLASFTAQEVGRSIVLEWTTASEKGLIGWNVYRAEAPTGPFGRLNAVAIPAYGDGSGETGYIFQDETARPGRRYYYRVEGLTDLGLAERSHVVSGRVTPSR